MKARKEIHKSVVGISAEEMKRAKKLKPAKKEKNQKQSIFEEIDELEDIDMDYKHEEFDEDLYEDDEDEDY